MAELLYRIGRFAARRRLAVMATWIAILAVAFTAFTIGGSAPAGEISIPGTPTAQVTDRLATVLPGAAGASGTVVFSTTDGTPFTRRPGAAIAGLVAQAAKVDGVTSVVDPFVDPGRARRQGREIADGRAKIAQARTDLVDGQRQLDAARKARRRPAPDRRGPAAARRRAGAARRWQHRDCRESVEDRRRDGEGRRRSGQARRRPCQVGARAAQARCWRGRHRHQPGEARFLAQAAQGRPGEARRGARAARGRPGAARRRRRAGGQRPGAARRRRCPARATGRPSSTPQSPRPRTPAPTRPCRRSSMRSSRSSTRLGTRLIAQQAQLDATRQQLGAKQAQIDAGLAEIRGRAGSTRCGNASAAGGPAEARRRQRRRSPPTSGSSTRAAQGSTRVRRHRRRHGEARRRPGAARRRQGRPSRQASGRSTPASPEARRRPGRDRRRLGHDRREAGGDRCGSGRASRRRRSKLEAGATLLDLVVGRSASCPRTAAPRSPRSCSTPPATAVPTETQGRPHGGVPATPVAGVEVDFSSSIASGMPEVIGGGELVGLVVAAIVLFVMLGTLDRRPGCRSSPRSSASASACSVRCRSPASSRWCP